MIAVDMLLRYRGRVFCTSDHLMCEMIEHIHRSSTAKYKNEAADRYMQTYRKKYCYLKISYQKNYHHHHSANSLLHGAIFLTVVIISTSHSTGLEPESIVCFSWEYAEVSAGEIKLPDNRRTRDEFN